MLYRRINSNLIKWQEQSDRKPLILRGARQVGKTTVVEMFSKNFDIFVSLNLEKKEDRDLFKNNLLVDKLLQAIFLLKKVNPENKKTLIFIDEIQNSPEAISMMRYFYEEAKQYYFIAAGSLLEAMLGKNQINFPVGRVQYLFMYPLSFEEFLLAMGEKQALDLYNTIPLPDFAFSKLLDLFHVYTLIGGMPEIIKKYCETKEILSLGVIYQSLITSYLDDVAKYARNIAMIEIIKHCIEVAPFYAGTRIRFNGFGNSNYRSREIGEAMRMLERAMLVYLVYPTCSTNVPIIPDIKKSPKLQFVDTGLINYIVSLQEFFFKNNDLQSFYHGIIAEHIVGQEFIAIHSEKPGKIMFWVRQEKQANAEVDFVIQYKQHIIPVEVKSGKQGTLKSLHQFINKTNHNFSVRLYSGQIAKTKTKTPEGKDYFLLNLPYFLAGKIENYLNWFIE